MDLWLCWVLWALSLVCLGISLAFCARKFKRNRITVLDGNSVGMFVALLFSGFFIMLPSAKDSQNIWLNIADSLYLAIKLFDTGGTGDFQLADPVLNGFYQAQFYFLAFYAPATLICTVLSFFGDLINKLKIRRYAKRRNLLIFNELNERNLAIADNFLRYVPDEAEDPYAHLVFGNDFFDRARCAQLEKNKKTVVFCDVYKANNERSTELMTRANELGGIVLKEDAITLHRFIRRALKRRSGNKLTRYFLSGTDENENVRHAIEISRLEQADPVKNLALFVFAEGEANGHIIESLNTRKEFFVRRLSPSFMLAKDVLAEPRQLLVSPDDPEKDLKVLILGLGSYGLELAKFLCWFYQRARGNIELYIVDKDPAAAQALSGRYADMLDYEPDLDNRENDACFRVKLFAGVDVFGSGFAPVLEQIVAGGARPGLDAVYTVLGDDGLNVEASIHVRMLLDRLYQKEFSQINARVFDPQAGGDECSCAAFEYRDGCLTDKVRLFCIVHSDLVMGNVSAAQGFIKSSNICFVGADSSVYSYGNVFDPVEEQAAVVNNRKGKSVADEALIRYNGSEYIRRSSSAEVLYDVLVEQLYPVEDTADYALLRQKIGNKRWNAYMRTEGYTCFEIDENYRRTIFLKRDCPVFPVRQWRRGKWHNSIVGFDRLPKEEQENNYRDRAGSGAK